MKSEEAYFATLTSLNNLQPEFKGCSRKGCFARSLIMHIKINPTNIKLDDALVVWIENKIGGLAKFLKSVDPTAIEARVDIGKPSKHHHKGPVWYAEVNLKLPGRLLRATDTNKDLRLAINEVKDELQRQIKKYFGRMRDKKRK